MRYCYPQGKNLANLEEIFNQAFQNFNGLVHSEGTVYGMNNSLLEVACSNTSGMSGSPVIIDSKFAGIYLGGPPLIVQRIILKAIELIDSNQVSQAMQTIEILRRYDYFVTGQLAQRQYLSSSIPPARFFKLQPIDKLLYSPEEDLTTASLPAQVRFLWYVDKSGLEEDLEGMCLDNGHIVLVNGFEADSAHEVLKKSISLPAVCALVWINGLQSNSFREKILFRVIKNQSQTLESLVAEVRSLKEDLKKNQESLQVSIQAFLEQSIQKLTEEIREKIHIAYGYV